MRMRGGFSAYACACQTIKLHDVINFLEGYFQYFDYRVTRLDPIHLI